jgi:hypothetical protein
MNYFDPQLVFHSLHRVLCVDGSQGRRVKYRRRRSSQVKERRWDGTHQVLGSKEKYKVFGGKNPRER